MASVAERYTVTNKARKKAADLTTVVVAATFQAEKARKEAPDKIATFSVTIASSPLFKDPKSDQTVVKKLADEVVTGAALTSGKQRLEPENRQHVASTATISTATIKKSHPLNESSRKNICLTNPNL